MIPSSSRGYDDVVFSDGKTFLSYTNPATGDPTVVELLNGEGNGLGSGSQRSLVTKTVLTDGVSGFNTVDKKMEPVPQNDPDSLKLAPNGDLLLTSGDDGTIIDISNPGTPGQTVAFTQVTDKAGTPVSALDDVIKPNATAGTFYISDTAQNEVLAVHVSGLNLNDYYASVGSLNAFGEIDPTTGVFTPLVSATTTPGFPGFASPHGVEFVADATNPTAQLGQSMASFGPAAANNSTLLGSSSQVAQLVQVMAGFGGGSGAADGLNTAPLSAETSQQQLLTTPQHA
jgi:hypothetical protein